MKTKRRLLAFFFSLLLICQGCFSAQAEEKTPSVFVKTETGSREEEDRNAAETVEGTEEAGNSGKAVESAEHKEKSLEQESNHPITFTKELVNGGIQEVKDTEGSSHYLLEYLVRFDGKNFEGTHQENGYENVIFQDTLENEMLRFFNPAY